MHDFENRTDKKMGLLNFYIPGGFEKHMPAIVKWFEENGIEYYQTVPSLKFIDQSNINIAGVWNRFMEKSPHILTRIIRQMCWIWETHHEGGYWITFGRERG